MKTQSGLVDVVGEQPVKQADVVISTQAAMMTGTLVEVSSAGAATVRIGLGRLARNLQSRSCIKFGSADVGKRVVLMFEQERASIPIIVGTLIADEDVDPAPPHLVSHEAHPTEVEIDGKTVELRAQDSLVLRCGKASITLTHDGKIVIRGIHVVTHAEGVNRIKGGSVELN